VTIKKFELTRNTYQHFEFKLYQIRALRNFGNIRKGDLGGYVQKEANLSHDDDCWVYDSAKVYLDALVAEDARAMGTCWVYNRATVRGSAVVKDQCFILGDCLINDNSVVGGDAFVSDHVKIYEDCSVGQRAGVFGKARCHGASKIYGEAHCFGSVEITGTAKVRGNAKLYEGYYDSGCQESWSPYLVNVALHG
jgi:tetrahydrodipicolinate N-succinyltransferase